MESLFDYFKLGISNIAYFNVFEHILFIIALCGIYTFNAWRKVGLYLFLFFVGYQITFLLTTLDYISFPSSLLTFLLPLTILVTAVSNFFLKKQVFTNKYPSQNYRFLLAFLAGLIHGFSFPETLKSYLLNPSDRIGAMLMFDFGIISGILMIVFFLLFTCFFLTYFLRVHLREWNLMISGACTGISLYIMANKLLF